MDPESFKQLKEMTEIVLDKLTGILSLVLGYLAGHKVGKNGSGHNGNGGKG